jgi:glycerol-1-phosphate dehydrogenase [NAD(P)+]
MGPGINARVADVFRDQFGPRRALLVADRNTFQAAGDAVIASFRSTGQQLLEPFIFRTPDLYAEYSFVVELEEALKKNSAIPIAVGSGTINDLTKLASHRTDRPYMCVATAASMDGYTAFGASITHQGSKQTFQCPAPVAVMADLDVICAAPGLMNSWGYTDLLAKVTAGADWLLADALGQEPLQPQAWRIAQSRLRELVGNPAGVKARDPEAVRQLTEGLMLGGFAMQSARSSRAASGAEHQFSHLWDMQHHTHNGKAPSHGFKVAIGTLASTALYEYLLDQPLENLDVDHCCAQWPDKSTRERTIQNLFDSDDLCFVALMESGAKAIDTGELRQQLELVRSIWPAIRTRLRQQLIPFAELKRMLLAAGGPVEPEQIGISRQRLRESFRQVGFIRRRFTILDLASRTGLLDASLEYLFGRNGPWPIETA